MEILLNDNDVRLIHKAAHGNRMAIKELTELIGIYQQREALANSKIKKLESTIRILNEKHEIEKNELLEQIAPAKNTLKFWGGVLFGAIIPFILLGIIAILSAIQE